MRVNPTSLIIKATSLVLLELVHCSAESIEALCTRDAKELSNLFKDRKRIAIRPIKIPELAEEEEESRFLEMATLGNVFVDKTLMIKKILELNEKVIVINAPRRSGKTVNLNMLKDFFEIRISNESSDDTSNHQLSIPPPNATSTYRFFTEGILNTMQDRPLVPLCWRRAPPKHLHLTPEESWKLINEGETLQATYTDPLLIAKRELDIVRQHLGQYSVIYLDFKSDRTNWGWREETVKDALRNRICNVFAKSFVLQTYMAQHTVITDEKKATQSTFVYYHNHCTSSSDKLTDEDLEDSMVFFSKLLHLWMGKPVLILVDNYDLFFDNILFGMNYYNDGIEGYSSQIKNHIQLLKNFWRKTLSKNPYLTKAVITGTLSVSKKNIFAGITDIVYYNVIDNDLQEFYGFTQGEVQLLFDYFQIPPDLAQQALLFYKGYALKRNTGVTLYNMESIGKFLNYKKVNKWWFQKHNGLRLNGKTWQRYRKPVNYWLNFGKLERTLQPLIQGNEAKISFTEVDYEMEDALFLTKPIKNQTIKPTKRAINVALTMLLEMGFFTISETDNPTTKKRSDTYIRVTSQEIRQGLERFVNTSSSSFRV